MKTKRRQSVLARAARAVVEVLEDRRLLAAGDLDPTFGDAGKKVVTDWELIPTDSAIQVDNKILVSGFGLFDVGHVFRLNADGSIDRSFGSNGLASSGFGPYTAVANAVAVGPGGRIAVSGVAGPYDRGDTTPRQSTLVVYNSAGKLDTSFDNDGIVNAAAFPRGFNDVQFQADGKILAIGEKLVRYNQNGSLDTSFGGGDGIVDVSGKKIIVQPDGKVLALGHFALFRFNPSGAPDTSFDGDGVVPSVKGSDIAMAPGNDILLAGNGPNANLVTRFNANGSIDRAFGSNGNATVHNGTQLAVTANNVVVGSTTLSPLIPFNSFEITALTHAGQRDFNFNAAGNGNGQAVFGLSSTRTFLTDLAIQNGELLVVGSTDHEVNDPPGTLVLVPGLARVDIDNSTTPPPTTQTPFSGTPIALPGVIQAENFDKGGQGIAYNDTDAANLGGTYRTSEGVDIQQLPTADPVGRYYIGFVKPGEWLEYTINIPTAGAYDLSISAAHVQAGGQFHLELDGQRVTPNLTVPRTNNWTSFASVTRNGVTLPAGQHVLRLAFDAAGSLGYVGNFDAINIARFPGTPTQTPFKGTPFKPGDRIQAEDFDNGGQGVSFFDTTLANEGGAYRVTPVDIQPTTDAGGGFNVGWLKPGEWLEYTIDVQEEGNHDFLLRVASVGRSGSFSLVIGEAAQALSTPDTGGWQSWRDLRAFPVYLTAGTHVVRLQMFGVGSTGFTVNLNWLQFGKSPQPIP